MSKLIVLEHVQYDTIRYRIHSSGTAWWYTVTVYVVHNVSYTLFVRQIKEGWEKGAESVRVVVIRRLGACDLQESFWNRSIRSPPRDLVSYVATPAILSITCAVCMHQYKATSAVSERLSLHYSSGKRQLPSPMLSGQ